MTKERTSVRMQTQIEIMSEQGHSNNSSATPGDLDGLPLDRSDVTDRQIIAVAVLRPRLSSLIDGETAGAGIDNEAGRFGQVVLGRTAIVS